MSTMWNAKISSKIWTQVTVSISYSDNLYTTSASNIYMEREKEERERKKRGREGRERERERSRVEQFFDHMIQSGTKLQSKYLALRWRFDKFYLLIK